MVVISYMSNSSSTPWYKQFWPWFLITIPLISMVLSITMLNLAMNTEDSLVIDDYYKEGKGINMQLSKIQEAKVRDIRTVLIVDGTNISLRFVSGEPKTGEALAIKFHHATLVEKDFSLLLTRDANGIYRAKSEQVVSGKWKISLSPLNDEWKINNDLSFPRSGEIEFIP